jgi:hypothetical protein
MGYWAQLDNNRVVTQVVEATEEVILSGILGNPNNWIETSLTGEFRKNYAGVGHTYDLVLNCFYAPQPSESIGFDNTTCRWILQPPSGSNDTTGSI